MGIIILSAYYSGSGERAIGGTQRWLVGAMAPLHNLTATIASPFQHGWGYVSSIGKMRDDNIRLREQNRRLRGRVMELSGFRGENTRLKKLVGLNEGSGLDTVAARIIGRSPSSWQAVVIIDKGERDGIRKNMPVMVAEGVVGQVAEVGSGAANVILINDERSGIGVEVERTGQLGVVEGRVDGELRLRFLPKDADIRAGDRLITSGIGQVYPRRLLVGKVTAIKTTQYGMERRLSVKAAVQFNRLEEVAVVVDSRLKESPIRPVSAK